MNERNFLDLPVWQCSIDLARRVFRLTSRMGPAEHPEFVRALDSAALDIGNRIAAGMCRSRSDRRLSELEEARAAAARVLSMLWLADSGADRDRPSSREVERLKLLADRIEKYLNHWMAQSRGGRSAAPPAGSGRAAPQPGGSGRQVGQPSESGQPAGLEALARAASAGPVPAAPAQSGHAQTPPPGSDHRLEEALAQMAGKPTDFDPFAGAARNR